MFLRSSSQVKLRYWVWFRSRRRSPILFREFFEADRANPWNWNTSHVPAETVARCSARRSARTKSNNFAWSSPTQSTITATRASEYSFECDTRAFFDNSFQYRTVSDTFRKTTSLAPMPLRKTRKCTLSFLFCPVRRFGFCNTRKRKTKSSSLFCSLSFSTRTNRSRFSSNHDIFSSLPATCSFISVIFSKKSQNKPIFRPYRH